MWLIEPANVQLEVLIVNIWKSMPFVALILLAGLQGISQEMYEAARIDGASWISQHGANPLRGNAAGGASGAHL
jgi:ABC-type sugar transport system permease subunit